MSTEDIEILSHYGIYFPHDRKHEAHKLLGAKTGQKGQARETLFGSFQAYGITGL